MAVHLQPGDAVCAGKYRLLRPLGAGGFAQVFEAENQATRRRVALKVVHGDSAGPEVVTRLRREAVVSSRVRHRNVVDVYDLEEEGGLWFLVMEYLQGETLRQVLDRGGLTPGAAIALLLPVMRGLAVMHDSGVVHRDIKPENIYLARQDDSAEVVPKLIDFGICKVAQPDAVLPPVTRAGTQGMGTPAYISPEQYADSAGVDARADVYSMGVVLYECLTGRAPYDAPTQRDLMLKVLTTTPAAAHTLQPALPAALSAVVDRAMARDVDARYASIAALAEALAPFAAPDGAALPAPRSRARGLLFASSILLCLQAAGIYWAVTSLAPGAPGAGLLSPHGNVLAGFFLPPTAAGARDLPRAPELPRAEVAVVCDIPGAELYVNGERIAAVVAGAPLQLQLPPGLYRFEALRDGVVVASDLALVQAGRALELRLRAPGEALAASPPPAPEPKPATALVSTARPREPAEAPGVALSREQLSDVITSHLGELQRCYEQALQEEGQEPALEPTTLPLELGIAASGHVTRVRTGSPWLGLDECIGQSARSWRFPQAARDTELRFPLVFHRAGSAQLSAAQLSAVVARSKGMLQRCYPGAIQGNRVVRLDVDLEVHPSGDVSNVAIQGDDPAIQECIARTVRLWRFPSADEPTRTRFPVLLLPGA